MQPTHVPTRLPEGLGAEKIGAEMARLRDSFGLTQQEVSERLHIRARYVGAIEEGKFDVMPGKVYARGYVHSYAEFLGLDADQVVMMCFGGEGAVSNVTVHRPPPNLRAAVSAEHVNYRGIGIAAVVVLVVILAISQYVAREKTAEPEAPILTQNPEEMLDSMRTMMMPTPTSFECLTTDQWLACARADEGMQLLGMMDARTFQVMGDVDVSSEVMKTFEEDDAPHEDYDTPPHDDPNDIQDRA